jgi:hypothetical protein
MNLYGSLGKSNIVDNFPAWYFQVINPGFYINKLRVYEEFLQSDGIVCIFLITNQ